MPLEATCKDCNKPYLYPAIKIDEQTWRCPACQQKHDLAKMDKDLAALTNRINAIRPVVCNLNKIRKALESAHDQAFRKWEELAKIHFALDRKIAIISHEREILVGSKTVTKKTEKKPGKSEEEKARAALKNLSPEVRAKLLQQLEVL